MPDGRIAVAEVGAQQLTLLDTTTNTRAVIADHLYIGVYFTRAPGPVYLPTGVASDAQGTIYITCDMDNSVLKFTPQK